MLRDPLKRDPRGYIIPSVQADFPTAMKFVNTLIKSGIAVQVATKPFTVLNKTYAAGSYVIKTAQAFRAHVISMFEPQDHPNDFAYPGGPPRPPYDSAGWTVAFQMGIKFDRILEPFDGPFQEIKGFAKLAGAPLPAGDSRQTAGFLLSHQVNDSVIVLNRLLKAKEDVYWLKKPFQTATGLWPAGSIFIFNKPTVLPILAKAIQDLGVSFEAVDVRQMPSEIYRLKLPRLGVWDSYGGSMDSGWTQWILTQFEFPFEVVYAPGLDAGNLNAKYDVLVFVNGGIPGFGSGRGGRGGAGGGPANPDAIPAEYRSMVGSSSVDKTMPQLRKFVEEGGTVLTVGSATSLGYHLGLPIANHLVEKTADGREVPLGNQKYYVPGSVLRVRVDNTNPYRFRDARRRGCVLRQQSGLRYAPRRRPQGRPGRGLVRKRRIPSRSGWVWGDQYLWRGVQAVTAPVGKGKVFLFAPEITFRGQPHGTFKFLFNGIFLSSAESGVIGGVKGSEKNALLN